MASVDKIIIGYPAIRPLPVATPIQLKLKWKIAWAEILPIDWFASM